MNMIIADIGDKPEVVYIEGDAIKPDKRIELNVSERDEDTGMIYRSNDIQRVRLQVALSDVPETSSYRAQQLDSLTEAIKPLPAEYLAAAIPFLAQLMDVPFKRDLVEAFRAVNEQESPEQIEQRIKEAVQQALKDAQYDLKEQELELKRNKSGSEIRNLDAKAVQIGVQAAYSAMQAGAQVAQMPMIAPVADEVMKGAGYQRPTPEGHDPNFPTAEEAAAMDIRSPYIQGEGAELGNEHIAEAQENTSPAYPPVPQEPGTGMQGIETASTQDNLG